MCPPLQKENYFWQMFYNSFRKKKMIYKIYLLNHMHHMIFKKTGILLGKKQLDNKNDAVSDTFYV